MKGTMLARLGDCIGGYSTILFPSPASRERTHLARERNVLAAQRTIAGDLSDDLCPGKDRPWLHQDGSRVHGPRARLLALFGMSVLTFLDLLLVGAGVLMAIDGLLWYFPVRKEQAEMPR